MNAEELKDDLIGIIEGRNKSKDTEKNNQISINKMSKVELDRLIENAILNSDIESLKKINEASVSNISKCRIGKNKENVMIHAVKTLSIAAFEYFMTIKNVAELINVSSQKGDAASVIIFEKDNVDIFKIFWQHSFDKHSLNYDLLKYNINYHILDNQSMYSEKNIKIAKVKQIVKQKLNSQMTLNDLTLGLTFIKGEINKSKLSQDVLISDKVELLKKVLMEDMFDLSNSFSGDNTLIDFIVENKSWTLLNIFFKSQFYKNDFINKITNEKLNRFLMANAAYNVNLNKFITFTLKNNLIKENDTINFMDIYYKRGSDGTKVNNILKAMLSKEEILFPYYVKIKEINRNFFESMLYLNEKEKKEYNSKMEKYKILSVANVVNPNTSSLKSSDRKRL